MTDIALQVVIGFAVGGGTVATAIAFIEIRAAWRQRRTS